MAGTMDFDFRKRCAAVILQDGDMPEHQIVIYGLTAREVGNVLLPVFDLDSPYAALSHGGRRPGGARAVSKHFFNKRIMAHGESIGGGPADGKGGGAAPAVSGGGDEGGVGACDGEGSEISVEEAKAEIERWERAGSSDPSTGEEDKSKGSEK